MAQSVIVKKDEKIRNLFKIHGLEMTLIDFKKHFKKTYPKDWDRINKVYQSHERKQKPGKKRHPMPHPEKYLENTYKVFQKKLSQEKYDAENL